MKKLFGFVMVGSNDLNKSAKNPMLYPTELRAHNQLKLFILLI